jgi:hypothetical protein
MKKHTYRAKKANDVNWVQIKEKLVGGEVVGLSCEAQHFTTPRSVGFPCASPTALRQAATDFGS